MAEGAQEWPSLLSEQRAPPSSDCLDAIAEHDVTRLRRLLSGQADVLELITQGASLARSMGRLVEVVEEQAHGLIASLLQLSEDGRTVHVLAGPSLPESYNAAIEGQPIGPRAGSCGTAAYLRRRIIVTDIATDPLWEDYREVALGAGLRACWSTPIVAQTGEVLGTFALYYRQPARPTAAHLQLIALATHLASVALERARQTTRNERLLSALERERHHLRAVIERMPAAVFLADAGGHVTMVNGLAARFFAPGGSCRHRNLTEERYAYATHLDGRPVAWDEWPLLRALRHGTHVGPEEFEVAPPGGPDRILSVAASPLRGAGGEREGAVAVAWDVSAEKRAQRELDAEVRHKDEFLAMLAHELRNPLAAIGHAAHVIRGRLAGGKGVTEPLAALERQIRNGARLLDDLLDVARVSRGLVQLQRERVELGAVVRAAVQAQQAAIDARHHAVRTVLPPGPLLVEGDPTRLEQIVTNLVHNAVKYTPDGGHIRVELAREGAQAVVRVADDGIGIARDLLPRVFDLFVQADRSLARTQGGLGLGLTLVRRLVELHGGVVEAHSDGLGRGSTFVVRLPAVPERRTAARATPARAAPHRQVRRRVLVVEDHADAASLLSEALDASGHEVAVVHDGSAALVRAPSFRPDVALIDIGLPGMDGYELAQRLRAELGERTPILAALTGYGQEEDRERSRRAGMAVHFTKPFPIDALLRWLERPGEHVH